jgi:hypothetical protein
VSGVEGNGVARVTISEILSTISECKSPGFEFLVLGDLEPYLTQEGHYYLQVQFDSPEDEQSWTGVRPRVIQRGRKWMLSEHMTRNEIVQTCFLAVMTAVEHEVREHFKYRGRKIFNPHFDPDALWILARSKGNLDLRSELPGIRGAGDDQPR